MTSSHASGRLYIVATPIGCLEDITLRALRILEEVDLVLAEDTRRAAVLFQHHGLTTPRRSYHAHSTDNQTAQTVERLLSGQTIALISDAGTPLISDPGHPLVMAAIAHGITVESIPGPSAVITALTVAGIAISGFSFHGFLPRSGRRRQDALHRIARSYCPSVLYESPRRTAQTLEDVAAFAGEERPAALCRELTKMHEEVVRGSLATLQEYCSEGVRGEVCLVIAPLPEAKAEDRTIPASILDLITELIHRGMSRRDAAAKLVEHTDLSKKQAYQAVLDLPSPPTTDDPEPT